jgi:ectoine hydroxylase-related dioxygenase (phytanoyl-CoA dioxygenase family)
MDQATATSSVTEAIGDVEKYGVAILTDVLDGSEVASVRSKLASAVETSEKAGVPTRNYVFDPDENNTRVYFLFNWDPVFIDLIMNETALTLAKSVIGDDMLISNFSANIMGPGAAPMRVHSDQDYIRDPWPSVPLAVNIGWCIDDFTAEMGATQYVPGSHLLNSNPDPDAQHEFVDVVAPAGSLLIMDGRTWHRSGRNTATEGQRAGLFAYYTKYWLRPQVNWNIHLDPQVIANSPVEFRKMLGYDAAIIDYRDAHKELGTGTWYTGAETAKISGAS